MSASSMNCPACGNTMQSVFSRKVLNKYEVHYFECCYCGLIKTEKPYWIDEAYSSAIADMDTGLVQRNIDLSNRIALIIEDNFNGDGLFLDYAGGYGLFVRLMRDKGFDYYWYDKYCDNVFSRHFSRKVDHSSYELVTALEYMEHVTNPLVEASKIVKITDNFLFMTEIRPKSIDAVKDWWYLVPDIGQHITFYTIDSLLIIADKLSMDLVTNGHNIHLLTRNKDIDIFFEVKSRKTGLLRRIIGKFISRRMTEVEKRESLVWKDHQAIKDDLRKGDRSMCDSN